MGLPFLNLKSQPLPGDGDFKVLYSRHPNNPLQGARHYCQNPKCGSILKIPTDNPRDAFCCRGCEEQFYNCRCRVCSQLFTRKTVRRAICGRSKCRHEWQRHREFYGLRLGHNRLKIAPGCITTSVGHNASRNPLKTGLKSDIKTGRGWRVVAGPAEGLHEINLRAHPADAAASRTGGPGPVQFQRTAPPLNVIGRGIFKFPGPPAVVVQPARAAPPVLAIQSDGDGIDIPAFLRRTLVAAAVLP